MSPARFTSVIRHTREEPQSPALRRAAADDVRARWREVLRTVRAETERRAALLSAEDQQVQSMPDASPTKWHRAHVTWFFEQFLLVPHLQGYQVFDARFPFLFNSYYVGAGPRHARAQRGLITRPDCSEVAAFRAHVDVALERLVAEADESKLPEVLRILEIGIHHEQQHQELILTDLLHAFARNPVAHACDASWRAPVYSQSGQFVDLPSGVHPIGFAGEGYCLDNEQPAHEVYVQPARIARALVSNGQWLEFMTEGGYTTPSLWLSDGWAIVEAEGWTAPGYWREHHGAWHALTLGGLAPIDPNAPVMHVSYYEADAFARWAGKHLPTEFGVGGRRALRSHRRCLRRSLAVDPQRVSSLSRLSRRRRRTRRVQWKVYDQPNGAAGQLARHAGRTFARQLPQFLPSAGALAVQRPAAR